MKNEIFEVLLKKEGKKVYNYLLKILRNKEDAEDIMQETFVGFYKKMDAVNEKAYKSYLFRTAYHKALNFIKKRDKKRDQEINYTEMEHFQSEDNSSKEDKNIVVKNALSKLKPDEALLLELQYFQKMSYKQMAETLETTVSAIDSKLVRVKKKLIKILNKQKKLQENKLTSVYEN